MKLLKIQNSDKCALVDDWNYERLSKFKWRNCNGNIQRYCGVSVLYGLVWIHKDKKVSLASEVMNQSGKQFDHKDRDAFNNLEINLRLATKSQNQMNTAKRKGKHSSMFKGVCWLNKNKSWMAYLHINGVKKYLGYFKSEIDAAITYNMAAMKYHKEFACLNPVPFTW